MNHDDADEDLQGQDITSKEVLTLLFAGIPEFESEETLKSFIAQTSNAGVDIYEKCCAWAEERRRLVMKETQKGLFAATTNELWGRLAPYVGLRLGHADEPTLPFDPSCLIDSIEIFSDTRLRFSLGDLPGYGDTHKDRETKSRQQLVLCDVVVIAEEIGRAAGSAFLQEHVTECYRRRPDQTVIVALTKCERDIDVTNPLGTEFTTSQKQVLDYLGERKRQVDAQLAVHNRRSFAARDRLSFERKCIELEQREMFVCERNQRVEKEVAAWYAEITNGHRLPVFPLSARSYQLNVQGYDLGLTPELPLSPQSSNFPAFIHELASTPCKRIQREMRFFVGTTLPELFSFIEASCAMPSTSPPSYVEFNFQKTITSINDQISQSLDEFQEEYLVTSMFKAIREAIPTWIVSAGMLCDAWVTWHPSSHHACLCKKGCHKRRKQAYADWNKELLSAVQTTLDPLFRALSQDVDAFASNLALVIEIQIGSFIEGLRAATAGAQNEAFQENLEHRKSQMLKSLVSMKNDMKSCFKTLKIKATNNIHGGFFQGAMDSIYTAASKAEAIKAVPGPTGTRKLTRKQVSSAIFRQGVCNPNPDGPYSAILKGMEDEWTTIKIGLHGTAMETVRKTIGEIQQSFEQLSGHPSDVERTMDDGVSKAKTKLLAMVEEARKELEGPIVDLLRESGMDVERKNA